MVAITASFKACALSCALDSVAVFGSLIDRVLTIPFLSFKVMLKSPSLSSKAPLGTTEPVAVEPKYTLEDSPVSLEFIIS